MIFCAWAIDRVFGFTDVITDRYPVLWSLLSADAP